MTYSWWYYDALLLAVAVSLVLGVLVGAFTAVSFPTAIATFSGLAAVIVGHGLFVNGPVDSPADLVEPVEAPN